MQYRQPLPFYKTIVELGNIKGNMNLIIIYTVLTISEFFATPTPPPNNPWQGGQTGIIPPTGWILAGLLILVLIVMIYFEIRKFVKKLLKKK